jgi:glycosyltransferase involved in cell wall biosynthesis
LFRRLYAGKKQGAWMKGILAAGVLHQGFVLPVYNHGRAVRAVVEKLDSYGLPIILVDDGSDSENKALLERIAADFPNAVLVTRERNGGKGSAVCSGIEKAHELGLSHVLQIDADGQHDVERARFFLEASAAHPEAIICSYPEYDETVPLSRKKGRVVANTWVKIVTLSSEIQESMLGFRVYPVEKARNIFRRCLMAMRMGFDIEILVRFSWKGIPFLFYPVKVTYPSDGISHFRMVQDNVRISLMFSRLCLCMFIRSPFIICRNIIRRLNGSARAYSEKASG